MEIGGGRPGGVRYDARTGSITESQRERLLVAFRGEKAAHVPRYADLSYCHYPHPVMRDLPMQYESEDGTVALHRDLGVGHFSYAPRFYVERRDPILSPCEEAQDGETLRQLYHTPEGALTRTRTLAGGGVCSGSAEWGVKGTEDLPALYSSYERASTARTTTRSPQPTRSGPTMANRSRSRHAPLCRHC